MKSSVLFSLSAKRGRSALLAAALAASAAGLAARADWPLYRGGPQQFAALPGGLAARPTLRWRYKTAGPILSSPIVAQGRVYVGSSDKSVYAFGLRDGKKLWSFKTNGAVEAAP